MLKISETVLTASVLKREKKRSKTHKGFNRTLFNQAKQDRMQPFKESSPSSHIHYKNKQGILFFKPHTLQKQTAVWFFKPPRMCARDSNWTQTVCTRLNLVNLVHTVWVSCTWRTWAWRTQLTAAVCFSVRFVAWKKEDSRESLHPVRSV